jgi:hypothetical protein
MSSDSTTDAGERPPQESKSPEGAGQQQDARPGRFRRAVRELMDGGGSSPNNEAILEQLGEDIGKALKVELDQHSSAIRAATATAGEALTSAKQANAGVASLREEVAILKGHPQFTRSARQALIRGLKAGLKG